MKNRLHYLLLLFAICTAIITSTSCTSNNRGLSRYATDIEDEYRQHGDTLDSLIIDHCFYKDGFTTVKFTAFKDTSKYYGTRIYNDSIIIYKK